MKSFLSFDKMIVPVIIKVIFWLSMIGSFIFGIGMIGYGIISSDGGIVEIMIGILSFFVGPIIMRIYCEMLIVVFKMQESLVDIRTLLLEQENPKNETRYTP